MITKPKPIKPKICKNCGEFFSPERPFQKCCKYSCAIDYVALIKTKEGKTAQRKALKQFNDSDRSILLRTAQKVFNTYIRMRDGKKCISCKYEGEGRQIHAGHYMSQGGNSALRFDENNCSSQCVQCNTYKSGNLASYRINLIEKIGLDEVIRLETTKNTKLWTVEELHDIIKTYKAKINLLKNCE